MSTLRIDWLEMPAATLGPENPLPALHSPHNESTASLEARGGKVKLPIERAAYLSPGGALPHRLLDSYDRVRKPTRFQMAVLENEHLKASFLLERGGRLWSLVHKATNRELLYVNPVWQPGNLAIRNAWFSGGVEWNCGVIGHTSYGCGPLFAARVKGEDDECPVLRLYEWDRTRGVTYQIDSYLPNGSAYLLVRIKIVNPHDFDLPMYWWSNVALPDRDDLRIVAPTDHAYHHEYGTHKLKLAPLHTPGQPDMTYMVNRRKGAADGYFAIASERRPFVAGLLNDGGGLVQCSTARLRGRKMFAWGQTPGGRRWQEFLSIPGHPYIEVQAGLARNQGEYVTMPANSSWSWLEAYGLAQVEPQLAKHETYSVAYGAVLSQLDSSISAPWMEYELVRTEMMANRKPDEIFMTGSPWGSLEAKRRHVCGERAFCNDAMVFDETALNQDTAPWQALLASGELPYRKPSETPGAYMTQPEWLSLLKRSVDAGKSAHWLAYLHLGVMYYRSNEKGLARDAWVKSAELEPSAWAYRNLGVLAAEQERKSEAADLLQKACRMQPGIWQLATEACHAMLDAERPAEVLALLDSLDKSISGRARLRVQRAKAALDLGDLDDVEKILGEIELTDVREGEFSLSELWFWMHQKRISRAEGIPIDEALRMRVYREFPVPAQIDFRTHYGKTKVDEPQTQPKAKPAGCTSK